MLVDIFPKSRRNGQRINLISKLINKVYLLKGVWQFSLALLYRKKLTHYCYYYVITSAGGRIMVWDI